jgi:hypothetical protein
MARPIEEIEADLAMARSNAEAAGEIPWNAPSAMRRSAWKDSVEASKRVDVLEAELKAAQLLSA